jgi:hypothetical protein
MTDMDRFKSIKLLEHFYSSNFHSTAFSSKQDCIKLTSALKMPPGVSRMNVKKRKVSEESEESPDPGLMVAGRQRRAAAQKSHKVWDQLKPGAKPNMEEEQTPQQLQAETPGFAKTES